MKVTKNKNGRYSCDVKGVSYMILNKKNAYWVAAFKKRDADLRKEKRFSVSEYGFDKALELAVEQMKEWTDYYGLNERLSKKDKLKIAGVKNVGVSSFNNKVSKNKPLKKRRPVSRGELNIAIEEYLSNGGKITKINPVYGNDIRPADESYEFLLGNNA